MKRRVAGTAIAAGLVAAAACGDDPDPPSASELVESAVGVVAAGCSLTARVGSGVVVETPGQVATVAHTIAGATEITVVTADGSEHDASVRAFDAEADLAVLDAPTLRVEPLAVGEVELGRGHVLVWSRDDGARAKPVELVKRLRITIEDIYIEGIVERSGLEVAGDIEVGDSGGPVVTVDGHVVGIVYASSRERAGTGFATDDAELRRALDSGSATDVPNGRCV